ncbi:MAG: hypothetical protein ACFFEX_10620 [Candidatus Thorarchaeota archaeon]
MVESEEPAIIERGEPPRRMCYDLIYVYLILGFILISVQMVGDVLREYALMLTIGILMSMLLFTLYYVWINPPISASEIDLEGNPSGVSSRNR